MSCNDNDDDDDDDEWQDELIDLKNESGCRYLFEAFSVSNF